MEEKPSLFTLSVDPVTKANLIETARWARFLAIAGFVFLFFMVFFGVYMSVTLSRYETMYERGSVVGSLGASMAVMYIIFASIAFFPLLFTFRFASQMQGALNGNDQSMLNASFQNLKICYRYLGIVTIILLFMMALSLIFGIAGLALS